MRTLIACLVLFLTPPLAAAQTGYRPPDVAAQHAAMQRLAPLVGRWQGEASLLHPQQMTVFQSEDIEFALDGAAIIVRGTGYDTTERSGTPVFQALAVISYDDQRSIYEFRSYAMGRATTATGEVLGDGQFRWSINTGGPVRIRYTITVSGDTWNEIGEMSSDGGATWQQTIDMNLHRVRE
ncbi:MAG: hypothetical protein R3C30_13850 [Hyphomonadaceae bacterium]